jgi:hypothetical protein
MTSEIIAKVKEDCLKKLKLAHEPNEYIYEFSGDYYKYIIRSNIPQTEMIESLELFKKETGIEYKSFHTNPNPKYLLVLLEMGIYNFNGYSLDEFLEKLNKYQDELDFEYHGDEFLLDDICSTKSKNTTFCILMSIVKYYKPEFEWNFVSFDSLDFMNRFGD